jgi:hypothetical protein
VKHNIIPALVHLAEPIEKLKPLPGNPHRGDVEASMAVLAKFGQHRPVVAQGNSEDGGISLVGNTMTEAAKRLGWTHIAVAWHEESDADAMARALSDNRLAELGVDDASLMAQAYERVNMDDHFEVFEALGLDDFELAALSEHNVRDRETGYIPPTLIDRSEQPQPQAEEPQFPESDDAPSIPEPPAPKPERKAVVQYTLVFDDVIQQKRWNEFVRWLRSDPVYADDETTAAKLMAFLEDKAPF